MKRQTRIKCILISLLAPVLFCGAGRNIPKLNLDKNPVYSACNVSTVVSEIARDYDEAFDTYKDCNVAASGKVKAIEKNNRSLAVTFGSDTVTVTSRQKDEISRLAEGDDVTVYGRFDIGSEKKRTVSIKADHIVKGKTSLTGDHYIYGGKAYSDKESRMVSINGNRIRFRIPGSWVKTEVDASAYKEIFNRNISDTNTGRCFYINSVNGQNEPEIFSAFFFNDNRFLENNGDYKNIRGKEKAIVTNICPKETILLGLSTETSTTSGGVKIDHYVAKYDNYRVEFAFVPVKDGLSVMMHLYNDDSVRVDDILYVLNSLEVEQ